MLHLLKTSRDDSRGCGDAAHTSTSYSCKTPVSFRYRLTNLPVTISFTVSISFSVTLCVPDPRTCAIARKSLGSNQSQDWNRLPTATVNIEDPESKKPQIRKYTTYCTVLSAKIGKFSPQHQKLKKSLVINYRLQHSCGKVIFSQTSAIVSTGARAWPGGCACLGVCGWGGHACPGGVSAGEGMHAWGACMPGGCMPGGHVWHAHSPGLILRDMVGQRAGSTHPTGMHSCFSLQLLFRAMLMHSYVFFCHKYTH